MAQDPQNVDATRLTGFARSCLRTLQRGPSGMDREGLLTFWFEKQLFRLRSWCASLGVFAVGHASLHHRLRHNPDFEELLCRMLDSIHFNLEEG